MNFKYNPNDYIDYLKNDLNNLYKNYEAFINEKTKLNYFKFDNAFEQFFYGLKSNEVRSHYLESNISELRDYGIGLRNSAYEIYERI